MSPTAGHLPDADQNPPELRPLALAARAGDLDAVRDHLRAARSAGDEMALAAASRVVGIEGGPALGLRWATTEPFDPLARAVLGHAHALRGQGLVAERLLVRVTAEAPDLALSWTARTISAVRVGFAPAEVQRRHRRLLDIDPLPFHASDWLMFSLVAVDPAEAMPDTALARARELAATAPPGHPLHALPALAHFYQWRRNDQHLRRPEVQHEVAESASASVDHPQFGRPVVRGMLLTTFAALGAALHDPATTTRHLRRLDSAPDDEVTADLPFAEQLLQEWLTLHSGEQEMVR